MHATSIASLTSRVAGVSRRTVTIDDTGSTFFTVIPKTFEWKAIDSEKTSRWPCTRIDESNAEVVE